MSQNTSSPSIAVEERARRASQGPEGPHLMSPSAEKTKAKSLSIWNPKIMRRALVDSFVKLNPRKMMGNPVMFVVEVGSVVTTILLLRDMVTGHHGYSFNLQITLWLWFTVLF